MVEDVKEAPAGGSFTCNNAQFSPEVPKDGCLKLVGSDVQGTIHQITS